MKSIEVKGKPLESGYKIYTLTSSNNSEMENDSWNTLTNIIRLKNVSKEALTNNGFAYAFPFNF